MKNLKSNIIFKIFTIFILVLILLIPTVMVRSIIDERQYIQQDAIREVSEKWSNEQSLSGPYLSIPYKRYVKKYNAKDSTNVVVAIKEWAHFLPENLTINGNIKPEKRNRHIYEVVVYESQLEISGNFNNIDFSKFEIDNKDVLWDKATLNMGISDLKGIEKQIQLNWQDQPVWFNSGTSNNEVVATGINTVVNIKPDSIQNYTFTTKLDLKGSQHLYFTPIGKTTDVKLTSNWTTPSFTGTYLPDSHTINENGFTANWNILHLNRNYPQEWTGANYSIENSQFGTDLLLPVDNYKKSDRVAKYAILLIVLTFITFFFVEVLKKTFIHPIQYLLVGIALIVFYTLLISFSEHIAFNYAYILSTLLTLGLVGLYTKAILKSNQISLLIAGILTILYTFIFTIIQLESYALLIGSIGMFLILSLVMYMSRKIDWYSIKLGNETEETE